MKITLVLPPKGQMRHRNAIRQGRNGYYNAQFKAQEQELEEEKMLTLLYQHRPERPLLGPLVFGVKAFLSVPKSKSKKWQAAALAGEIRPISKPDLDNLIKNVKDVLKGVFWIDDCQVVEYLPDTGKYYGDPARWELEILTLEEWQKYKQGREPLYFFPNNHLSND